MLLRRGKMGAGIRGQSSHKDPDKEVLLLNVGIFTTSFCLLCGRWQSHVNKETKKQPCVIPSPSMWRNFLQHLFSTVLHCQRIGYFKHWDYFFLCFFFSALCRYVFEREAESDSLTWHSDRHKFMSKVIFFNIIVLVQPSKASGFLFGTSQRCFHEKPPGASHRRLFADKLKWGCVVLWIFDVCFV